jgi:RNA polymerase sigma-70 factor (ECF subfamily)
MREDVLALPHQAEAWHEEVAIETVPAPDARVRKIVEEHFDSLWRFMRRLGVAPSDLDDAMQEVVVIFASRQDGIPRSAEKSFLFGTAFRVASESRRFRQGRREVQDDLLSARQSDAPDAGDLLDEARARAMLDDVLEAMPLDLRAVFTLYEIEELTMAEVADLLAIPPGTVASRLRRARESFEAQVERLQARMSGKRRGP